MITSARVSERKFGIISREFYHPTGMRHNLFRRVIWNLHSHPYLSVCTSVSICSLQWDNTKDGYYIAPAFMDKVVVHLAKNFMKLPNIKVSEIPRLAGLFLSILYDLR